MGLFEIRNVSKSFGTAHQSTHVLEGLSVVFPCNGLVIIHGASGCGKSTLLNLFCGMDKPTSGSILFDGTPLEKQSPKALARIRRFRMGRVFQHYELLPELNALENVIMPLLFIGESMAVAQKLGEELLKTYGLSECSKKKLTTLSGGEKQRLGIIRAIIRRPQVLFADEPTGALDHDNAQVIADMLLDYSKKALVIVVTHDLPLFEKKASVIYCLQDHSLRLEKAVDCAEAPPDRRKQKNKSASSSWSSILAKRHLRQRKKIHFISLLAAGIAWSSCLLTVGFAYGVEPAILEASTHFLDATTATVSKVSKTPVEGSPLTLMQSTRPSVSEMALFSQRFESMRFAVDLNPLFAMLQGKWINHEISGFSFCPLSRFSFSPSQEKLLMKGKWPVVDDFDTLIINREMEEKLKINESSEEVLDSLFFVTVQGNFEISDPENRMNSVTENLYFSRPMRITAIVQETSFLNEPRVFYSHRAATTFFQDTEVPHLSEMAGKSVSWLEVLEKAASNTLLSSYKYLVFVENEATLEKLYQYSQKDFSGLISFEITSHAFSHRKALLSIAEVLRIALVFFVMISLVGSLFVLGISGYSSFISKLKESAILSSMGATYREIGSIFMTESGMIGLLSGVFGIFLSLPFQSFLNLLFDKKLGIGHPISTPLAEFLGIPFFLMVLVSIISWGLSVVATGVPIALFKKGNLVAYLRDE